MNDLQLGRLLRMRRMRRGWRLRDVADACNLAVATVGRGELGAFASVSVARRHAAALDVRLEWQPIARGADVARTLDDEHAAIVEIFSAWLRRSGYEVVAEASFSIYGERGRIDLLAYGAATSMVCIVEVKTELSDLQELLGAIDVRERLASRIAADRNWAAARRVSVLAVAATSHNRRVVASHPSLFADWERKTFRHGTGPQASTARQLIWIPAAAASRSAWLAGRRRVG